MESFHGWYGHFACSTLAEHRKLVVKWKLRNLVGNCSRWNHICSKRQNPTPLEEYWGIGVGNGRVVLIGGYRVWSDGTCPRVIPPHPSWLFWNVEYSVSPTCSTLNRYKVKGRVLGTRIREQSSRHRQVPISSCSTWDSSIAQWYLW